jgi:small conductance mechanosensitive channel
LAENPEISLEPPPQIGIAEFADSAINLGLRYWVPTKKYFQVQYQVNQTIHRALTKAGIHIPFPQRDVHLVDKTV